MEVPEERAAFLRAQEASRVAESRARRDRRARRDVAALEPKRRVSTVRVPAGPTVADLELLLGEPGTWRFIAAHALAVREGHPFGSPAWSVLTRLASVADDVVQLADDPCA